MIGMEHDVLTTEFEACKAGLFELFLPVLLDDLRALEYCSQFRVVCLRCQSTKVKYSPGAKAPPGREAAVKSNIFFRCLGLGVAAQVRYNPKSKTNTWLRTSWPSRQYRRT